MRICTGLLYAVLCGGLLAQPAENTPKFEVADIHSSPKAVGGIPAVVRGPFYSPGHFELRFATMVDMIGMAYGVDQDRVTGGPNWLEMDRWDILAKTADKTTAESRKLMMQGLLADRFHLVIKKDTKPIAAFALTAKHPLMKESDGQGETGCKFDVQQTQQPPRPPGSTGPQTISLPVLTYTCKNTSMESFATALGSAPGVNQYLDNKMVVDQTGLEGHYDFALKYTLKVPNGMNVTGENIPLLEALDKQLGLKLGASTAPVPVLAVVSVDEKPTPNRADIDKIFPPLPSEFEVAEVKPSPPSKPGDNNRPEIKNGRLFLPGIPLKNLIQLAWDMPFDDDYLVGAPKWMNDDRYDIIAKAPADVPLGDLDNPSQKSIPLNIDALRPMLQNLIKEKFKMTAHTEQKPLPAYILTASKQPKLKPADLNERTKWYEGAQAESTRKDPSYGRLVTCQNVTMAQFADMLRSIAPGNIHNDVIDETGLKGGYDFTFSFSPQGLTQQMGGGAPSNSTEAAAPNNALSLLDALPKELGLKLEQQKRPTMVLVIDHIDQKPTDN